MADEMYRLLPAIYRRYDETGALRDFLELPGGQLDQLYSYASAALGLHDVRRVDGELLPLLADWIGWHTNRSLPLVEQRGEVRNAPALYQATGLIPVIGATVKRTAKVRSRVKEFVHNVALTNNPERLNLWQLTRTGPQWQAGAARRTRAGARRARRDSRRRDYHGDLLRARRRRPLLDLDQNADPAAGRGDPSWSESTLLSRGSSRYRHPSAAARDSSVFVFWSAYDPPAAPGRSNRARSATSSGRRWRPSSRRRGTPLPIAASRWPSPTAAASGCSGTSRWARTGS